jgi:tRNA A58 N-methylase Trm61
MSPEQEFCELVGALVGIVKPAFVIETGVGQGFTTRRVARALRPARC